MVRLGNTDRREETFDAGDHVFVVIEDWVLDCLSRKRSRLASGLYKILFKKV